MGITRRLPQTDDGRDRALTTGKERKDTVTPADMAITPATEARLDIIQPGFQAKMLVRGVALSVQSASTSVVDTAKALAKMFTSHFIQVFNLGVHRGVYPKADRAYYQLDVNSEAVPHMSTEQEILQWGERIKPGNVARLAAGGAAMSNPTEPEVTIKVLDFKTKNEDQANKKTAFDQAQESVEALHSEADKVIKKIWDEVETFYNEEEAPSKRRKAREWGVVYVSDIKLTFNFALNNSADGNPVEAVECELTETNNTVFTNALGTATME
ncbi:MAG: hypothetical protein JJE25_07560, partial [Bacteroidia bacterium]|nr:hypothetical protein [Bacteroidia bacterium]